MDSYYIHEYIDEIRFSDVARYTDSFNVPNTPYGQAVTDNRTLTELIEDLEEEKQLKVLPTNIRNQITILGVTGNLIPGIDTSDANAIASDIVQDKTAYVNGEKLTGALTMFNYSFSDLAEHGYDLSGKSEEDPFVLTVDEDGLKTALKMPDRLSLESQSYFPYSISNLNIAEEANITSNKIVQGNTIFGVEGTAEAGVDINDYFMNKIENGDKIQSLIKTIPQLDTSKVTRMDSMFDGCTSLTAIPELDTSSATNMRRMFTDCTNLTTIPQLDTSKVTRMDSMFQGCTSLTAIPELDTSSATNMNAMFANCTSLTAIPQLDTSNVTDTGAMFDGCTSLTTIPKLDTSSATETGAMFQGCTSLTAIPELDTSSATNMDYMFANCTSLTAIPQLDTSNVTEMMFMFDGCTSLTTIPELDVNKVTMMMYMFNSCDKLSDESLNNILQMCISAVAYNDTKTLTWLGLSSEQAEKCATLSNYQAFLDAGWTR